MKITIEFKNDGSMKKLTVIENTQKESKGGTAVISQYGKTFDSNNSLFHDDMEYNLAFVKWVQELANVELKEKGVLVLNDLYDLLGFERTKLGAVTGWTYKKGNPDADEHVYIDMIKVDGEDTLLLDFNVDGCIIKYLKD